MISFRDLQVLAFICRFGVVNRTAVQWWAGTGRSVTLDRERRLREARLIEVYPPIGRSGPLLAVTARGLRLSELEALLRGVPDDHLGPTEHALYLTAAM